MTYIINTTNGNVLTTIQDGTTNSATGLTLIGKNYTSYGELSNENFVRLLENFADTVNPQLSSAAITPLKGTLWYDTSTNILRVYNGINWVPTSQRIVAGTTPAASGLGDQWWDTTNNQLYSWTGSRWTLIGPSYSSLRGLSGSLVSTLTDSSSGNHDVVIEYTNNNAVTIASGDPTFTLATQQFGFDSIAQGLNVANNVSISQTLTVTGNATFNNNSIFNNPLIVRPTTGPAMVPATTNTYDIGTPSTTFKNVYVGGNVAFTSANIRFANSSLILQNFAYQGNVDIYTSGWYSAINPLHIDGNTGYISVLNDPVSSLHVSTKNYVDTNINSTNQNIINLGTASNLTIAQLRSDTTTYISSNINGVTNSINSVNYNLSNSLTSNIATLNQALSSNVATLNNNINGVTSAWTANAAVQSLAIDSTNANVTAANASIAGTYSAIVTANAAVVGYINSINLSLTNSIANLAPTNNPTFTGTPRAPTPSVGDNSTKVATTAFVQGQIAAQKFNYTVSANPPSGGNDGDFWFQIG
jgi:hypothetical protein